MLPIEGKAPAGRGTFVVVGPARVALGSNALDSAVQHSVMLVFGWLSVSVVHERVHVARLTKVAFPRALVVTVPPELAPFAFAVVRFAGMELEWS